jgi:hypothetical protein
MNNPSYIDWSPVRSYDVTWNFAKVRINTRIRTLTFFVSYLSRT